MRTSYYLLPLCCFLNTAVATTFPSVYEPRRLTVEEALQIVGPANDRADDFGSYVEALGDINGDSLMDFAIGWDEQVIGFNDNGQKSQSTQVHAMISIPVAPEPPATASALAYSSRTVEIFWSRVVRSTPAAQYELYRNGVLIDTMDVLSYMDRDVMPGNDYNYTIRSVSAFGLRSEEATSTTVTTP